MYINRDGYSRNLLNNTRLDGEDVWSIRGSLLLEPTETFKIVLSGEYTKEDSTRNNAGKIVLSPGLPNPYLTFPPDPAVVPPDPRDLFLDFKPTNIVKNRRINLTIDWDIGFASLRAITGWTKVDNVGTFELDGSATAFAYNREDDFSRNWTQSLQLSSTSEGPFQWIVGADYFNEKATQNFDARLLAFLFPPGTPVLGPTSPISGIVWDSSLKASAWSIYADFKYDLTEQLRVIASARYNRDKKSADFSQTLIDPLGILGVGTTIVIPAQPRLRNGRFTPRFGLEYRPNDDILLYATATNGFKSGGFNLLNTGETFGPEKVWSYEAGVKAEWLDKRLRTNFTAFYYDYQDLQVLRFSGFSNFVSNADARIYGFEADLIAKPFENFSIDAGFAYLNARYTDYLTVDSNNPGAGTVNLDGNIVPRSPSVTFNLGAEYAIPLGEMGDITVRGELLSISKIRFDQFETAALVQGGYTLLNGRVSYVSSDGRWNAAIWGRNLTDKTYIHSMVRVDQFFGTIATYGAPRTFGVELGFKF
jgi:iron complex outermembrane recepter protein